MSFERELETALEAARIAGALILDAYQVFEPIPNAPAHISTEVDLASQEAILRHLRRAFPDDSLVAEEKTPTLAEAPKGRPRVWVVDPIDGTRGFAQKNGEFSVMIALMDPEGVALGVVMEPVAGRYTFARRGGGCRSRTGETETTSRVSDVGSIDELVLTQSRSRAGRPPTDGVRRLEPGRVVETYSAGIKLAMVARGEADAYVNQAGFRDWDICAGQILVEEAGGRVSDLYGEPIRYGHPGHVQPAGLIASSAGLHAGIVERMRRG